jgi:hypothetical protein
VYAGVNPKMARQGSNPRFKGHLAAIAVLFLLAVSLVFVISPRQGFSQKAVAAPSTSALSGQNAFITASNSKPASAHPAPDAIPFPFLRVVVVLVLGFLIHAARLANKFRRYLGVGLFANPYAILFMILGAGVCGVPMTSESILRSIPSLGSVGPWVADLSGILTLLVLPAIRPRRRPRGEDAGNGQELPGLSGSSSIFSFFEDEISLRLQIGMQDKIVWACKEYSWKTIKLAAPRALADEMAIRPLKPADEEAAKRSIAEIPMDGDADPSRGDKYQTLMVLLRCISFRLLFRSLALAKLEAQG